MKTLHFADLVQAVVDAGLADLDDVTGWLEARGLCAPAVDQYARGIIDAALIEDADPRRRLEGVFNSGLTLGLAVAEHDDVTLALSFQQAEQLATLVCDGAWHVAHADRRELNELVRAALRKARS